MQGTSLRSAGSDRCALALGEVSNGHLQTLLPSVRSKNIVDMKIFFFVLLQMESGGCFFPMLLLANSMVDARKAATS